MQMVRSGLLTGRGVVGAKAAFIDSDSGVQSRQAQRTIWRRARGMERKVVYVGIAEASYAFIREHLSSCNGKCNYAE